MNVGIDLGTTNTLISYITDGGIPQLLDIQNGGILFPSCVYAGADGIITGESALKAGLSSPENFISSAKTLMGEQEKRYVLGNTLLNPTDAARLILTEARGLLSQKFPEEREFCAFVTVPATFESRQRAETRKALLEAGFTARSHCVIDEPVAAAIAYSPRLGGDGKALVIDFGGGTLDVSLLELDYIGSTFNPARIKVLKSGGDRNLGGDDFDGVIAEMAFAHIRDNSPAHTDLSCPAREQRKTVFKVRHLAAEAKKELSKEGALAANMYDGDLFGDSSYEFDFDITYEEYEKSAHDLISRVKSAVIEPFSESGYKPADVQKVLLVGGMAVEPFLRGFTEEMFGADKVILPPDRMELVAKGAAICNSALPVQVSNRSFTSIGVLCINEKGQEDIFTFLNAGEEIDPNAEKTKLFKTMRDFSDSMVIDIIEFAGGDYKTAKKTISTLTLNGLTPDFADKQTVEITFSVNEDKYVVVSAKEVGTGRKIDCNIRL